MPSARASLARGFSSLPYLSVSPGSTSLRRNFLPWSTRNGSVNSLTRLIISFAFMGLILLIGAVGTPRPTFQLLIRPRELPDPGRARCPHRAVVHRRLTQQRSAGRPLDDVVG